MRIYIIITNVPMYNLNKNFHTYCKKNEEILFSSFVSFTFGYKLYFWKLVCKKFIQLDESFEYISNVQNLLFTNIHKPSQTKITNVSVCQKESVS